MIDLTPLRDRTNVELSELGLTERVEQYFLGSTAGRRGITIQLTPAHGVTPMLSLDLTSDHTLGEVARIGATSKEVAYALASVAFDTAVEGLGGAQPNNYTIRSLTAGVSRDFWKYDTAVQGVEAHARSMLPELERRGVGILFEGDGVRYTNLRILRATEESPKP